MTLRADSISFAYDPAKPILRDLTASFPGGSVTAVVGPNGAGKSTLLRLLMGLLTPASGTVSLDGEDISRMPTTVRPRRLVYIPQRTSVAFGHTARAVVAMGQYSAGGAAPVRAVDSALAEVGLTSNADAEFGTLSAGQQQRVTLARALVQLALPAPWGPRALLADEPVASMDPRHAGLAMEILRDLAKQGLTVVVATHDLSGVLRDADRTLVVAEGHAAAEGPTHDVLGPPVLERTFGVRFEVLRSETGACAVVPAPRAVKPQHGIKGEIKRTTNDLTD